MGLDAAAHVRGFFSGVRDAAFWRAVVPAFGRELARNLSAERDRWVLWLPVATASGILLYFALPFEPSLVSALLVTGAILLATLCAPAEWRVRPLLIGSLAAATGLVAAMIHARIVEAPVLAHRIGPLAVSGIVERIDRTGRGNQRLVIVPDPIEQLAAEAMPARIRITLRHPADLASGDRIRIRATLYPPPGPTLPGGHDFQREAFFERIGAVGFAFGEPELLARGSGRGLALQIEALRDLITRRIFAALPAQSGGVAAALITGKRGAVPDDVSEAFRDAGLAHLLAIAGMHMAMVAGAVFVLSRRVLAAIPALALRLPVKKCAAALALLVSAGYLAVSGAGVSVQRAFLMYGVMLVALLTDRLRQPMRVCALAALAVMLIDPVAITGPSFQMSFGAVVSLIAFYETRWSRFGRLRDWGGRVGTVLIYAAGIVATTLIATIGTDPFGIFHFHRVILYAALGNLIAIPISGFWIMPWALIGCLAMPFGAEALPLRMMGAGIDFVIWAAHGVAELPGDVWAMPELPAWGILMIVLGGLWICLWRGSWRRWGVPAIILGYLSMMTTRPPDLLISGSGKLMAVREADGQYAFSSARGERITRADWSLLGGVGETWPIERASADGRLDCQAERCVYRAGGATILLIRKVPSERIDCRNLDAIVAIEKIGWACRRQMPVIDRIDAWRGGTTALWIEDGRLRLRRADAERGARPWVPMRAQRFDDQITNRDR